MSASGVSQGKGIFATLLALARREHLSFHTPGHKNNIDLLGEYLKLDTTELDVTDNLHNPKACINHSQRKIADVFGVEQSYLLVNGATAGIHASLMSLNPGDKCIIDRNCHYSVFSGLILSGVTPIFTAVDYDVEVPLPPSVEQIRYLLGKHADAKAVLITSPNYFGLCADLIKIREITKGIPLFIDAAHGAHLAFSERLPLCATKVGAEVVVHGVHKTLPCLTQGAILHTNNMPNMQEILKLLQTSSPSFLLMSSIERAIMYMAKNGEKAIDKLVDFSHSLENVYESDDPTKLYIRCGGVKWDAKCIFPEFSSQNGALFILSVGDEREHLQVLKQSIKKLTPVTPQISAEHMATDVVVSPREAYFSEKHTVRIEDGVGRICGQIIYDYPPGIPIIGHGERVTHDIAKILLRKGFNEISVMREGK